MVNKEINKNFLLDWIDRPPSNSDLNVIIYITNLQQKVEQLENIRKEAIKFIKENAWFCHKDNEDVLDRVGIECLLNILNKGSDKIV